MGKINDEELFHTILSTLSREEPIARKVDSIECKNDSLSIYFSSSRESYKNEMVVSKIVVD